MCQEVWSHLENLMIFVFLAIIIWPWHFCVSVVKICHIIWPVYPVNIITDTNWPWTFFCVFIAKICHIIWPVYSVTIITDTNWADILV